MFLFGFFFLLLSFVTFLFLSFLFYFCFVFVFLFCLFVCFVLFLFPCFVRVCISFALFNSYGFEQAYRLVYFYLLLIYSRHRPRPFTFFSSFCVYLRKFIFQIRRPIFI